jgi:hypothetical protein
MVCWEYQIITLGPTGRSWRAGTDVLDAFGRDGWELVAVVPSGPFHADVMNEEQADRTLKHEPPDAITEAYDHSTLEGQAAFLDRIFTKYEIEIVEIPVAEEVQPQPGESGSVTAFLRRPTS